MKYSDLTPAMIGMLRVYRAIEQIYPSSGDRATRTLNGYEAWRKTNGSRTPPSERENSREHQQKQPIPKARAA